MFKNYPLNIIFEILIICIFILISYYGELVTTTVGWIELHLLLFLFAILSITARTIWKNVTKRRFISAFFFGYVFGIYLWSMYSITESTSIKADVNINNILAIIFGVLAAGLAFAFISSAISFLFERLIKKMWGLDDNK